MAPAAGSHDDRRQQSSSADAEIGKPNTDAPTSSDAIKPLKGEQLPLYHRPGSVVVASSDRELTDDLLAALPRSTHVEAFTNGRSALRYLLQEPTLWEKDFQAHQSVVDGWREGRSLIREMLRYWQETRWRYKLTAVCVMDDGQPDALKVLARLRNWPGQKVLAASADNETGAIAAFNQGLIDRSVVKGATSTGLEIAKAVASLHAKPNPRYDQVWRSTLKPEHQAVMGHDGVGEDLHNLLRTTFVEWVVIGQPFGILGLEPSGAATWLQLEPSNQLEGLAELAEHTGATPAEAAQIRAGQCVTDVELQQALGKSGAARVLPAFYVGRAGSLLAAMHRIESKVEVATALSHSNWLAMNSHSRSGNQSNF